jgi:hypothetical protein
VASRLTADGTVVETTLDGVHRYRILEEDEPRGRPATADERTQTAKVMPRVPPRNWRLTVDWKPIPSRRRGALTLDD